jgi:5-bromo-4-chloroindolyl phosphate hydrolysis protein
MNAETTIEKLLSSCEELCDELRKMRRETPNRFYDTANEKLLKNIDSTLNGYYQWAVTEEREVRRLNRELNETRQEIQQLEYEIAQLEQKESK